MQTIVYIITKLELGGAQKVCLSLFNDNPNAYIISGDGGTLAASIAKKQNVITLPSLKREASALGIFKEMKALIDLTLTLKKLKKEHSNIIAHTHSSKAGILGRWAAWLAGIKRVHTVHGFAFHPYQSKLGWYAAYMLEWLTAPITTHFICVSQADIKTGCRLLPGFKKKHSLIRAAVEDVHFRSATIAPYPHSSEPFVFGTISCFKKQKNVIDLLKAFKYTHDKNRQTRLEIIGDGEQRAMLERWIVENHLSDAVTLHGWQSDVAPFLKQWHCFVLSSLWEGLPCAVIEARLAKLPVLAYDAGGIREVIHHGVNGFIYTPKDWQALASDMVSISTDELLCMTVKHYPDKLIDFDTRVMIEKHQKLYQQL